MDVLRWIGRQLLDIGLAFIGAVQRWFSPETRHH
jgi:hypothetical protein